MKGEIRLHAMVFGGEGGRGILSSEGVRYKNHFTRRLYVPEEECLKSKRNRKELNLRKGIAKKRNRKTSARDEARDVE